MFTESELETLREVVKSSHLQLLHLRSMGFLANSLVDNGYSDNDRIDLTELDQKINDLNSILEKTNVNLDQEVWGDIGRKD